MSISLDGPAAGMVLRSGSPSCAYETMPGGADVEAAVSVVAVRPAPIVGESGRRIDVDVVAGGPVGPLQTGEGEHEFRNRRQPAEELSSFKLFETHRSATPATCPARILNGR